MHAILAISGTPRAILSSHKVDLDFAAMAAPEFEVPPVRALLSAKTLRGLRASQSPIVAKQAERIRQQLILDGFENMKGRKDHNPDAPYFEWRGQTAFFYSSETGLWHPDVLTTHLRFELCDGEPALGPAENLISVLRKSAPEVLRDLDLASIGFAAKFSILRDLPVAVTVMPDVDPRRLAEAIDLVSDTDAEVEYRIPLTHGSLDQQLEVAQTIAELGGDFWFVNVRGEGAISHHIDAVDEDRAMRDAIVGIEMDRNLPLSIDPKAHNGIKDAPRLMMQVIGVANMHELNLRIPALSTPHLRRVVLKAAEALEFDFEYLSISGNDTGDDVYFTGQGEIFPVSIDLGTGVVAKASARDHVISRDGVGL